LLGIKLRAQENKFKEKEIQRMEKRPIIFVEKRKEKIILYL
jgi:hypothetical protein